MKNTFYILKKVYSYVGSKMLVYFLLELIQDINGILLEVTLVNVVLDRLESNATFDTMLKLIVAFGVYFILFQFIYNMYGNKTWKACETTIKFQMTEEFSEKSKYIDTASYDCPEFYDAYVKAKEVANSKAIDMLQAISILFRMIARIIIIVVFFSTNSVALMLFMLVTTIVSIILTKKSASINYRRYLETVKSEKRIEYIGHIFNKYEYAKDMRMYSGMKNIYFDEYDDEIKCKKKAVNKYKNKLFGISFILDYVFNSFLLRGLIILLAAYLLLVRHSITYAFFATIIPALMDINDSMTNLVYAIPRIFENNLFIQNYITFMNTKSPLRARTGTLQIPNSPKRIRLENVSFGYTSEKIIDNISFDIEPCEKIAIVGVNGVGKSTIIKLITRLYDVSDGIITLDGNDIRDYNIDAYYHYFGTVFQDFKLYNLKLGENVLMDLSNSNDLNQIEFALSKMDIEYITDRGEQGIDTYISKEFDKSGILLSGGEAQKLAIARVFAKEYPILIMDEPSSALDPISEYKLNQLLIEECKNKTIIFVSHRLSTTRLADKIILLGKEGILEQGNHQELMRLNGIYANMFMQQASSYGEM